MLETFRADINGRHVASVYAESVDVSRLDIGELSPDDKGIALMTMDSDDFDMTVNPIIVRYMFGTGRYQVIDGAKRVSICRERGFTRTLAYVLESEMPDALVAKLREMCRERIAKANSLEGYIYVYDFKVR